MLFEEFTNPIMPERRLLNRQLPQIPAARPQVKEHVARIAELGDKINHVQQAVAKLHSR